MKHRCARFSKARKSQFLDYFDELKFPKSIGANKGYYIHPPGVYFINQYARNEYPISAPRNQELGIGKINNCPWCGAKLEQ